MARRLFIAGIDRWPDYIKDSLQIEAVLTYQIDSARFQVRGEQPSEGDEVIIEDDGLGRLFAGIIVKVELAKTMPDRSTNVWQVDVDDYSNLIDRRLVMETYQNMAADAIFRDIATKYCPGFTTNGVRSGAPVVEELMFDYKPPSECFKELCDYVGWQWQVTYYKDLQFFNAQELGTPAPMTLEPGGYFRNLKHQIDQQGLRNRVYVRGGTMLSDPWTYEIKTDGSARAWVLPHKPHDITVKVGGVAKTVGIENVDDEATKDFLMNYEEKYVRCSSQTPTPAAGTTLSFTYKYDIDVITMVEDIASQQAIAKVQGGDGVYEHVIVDDSLTTIDAAEAAGLADLREHANPQVKGSFETEVPGWQPGQLVTINLPDRGITGTFLVQKVTITPCTPDKWTYRVEYGGRLLGIADWLQALWKAQQKKKLNETALLHKFHYGQETAKVTDEVQGTLRTPPWKVEQGLETELGSDSFYSKTETTQADFASGTLTNIVATSSGDLELAPIYWQSPKYNDSSWGLAYDNGAYGIAPWYTNVAGWPDANAHWIWDRASTGNVPVGSCYFRKVLSLIAATDLTIYITCDNEFELYVDGELKLTGNNWQQTYSVVLTLAAGDHTIAVKGTNGGTADNPAGLLVSVKRNSDGVFILRSDGSWKCLGYIIPGVQYESSGSRVSPVYDISPVGIAASSTISWNATLPANTSLTVETNLSFDGGVTWQGWQVCTNGGVIPGITEGTDLSKARLQIRQTLSTTDTTVTPQLHDVTIVIRPLVQFATVGGLMIVWQPGSEAWAQPQYRTSTDGITWSAWQGVDPGQRGPIEVPYPGYVRLKANSRVQARNWKKPFVESDTVCGFVVCGN